jgi:hypothetical protein
MGRLNVRAEARTYPRCSGKDNDNGTSNSKDKDNSNGTDNDNRNGRCRSFGCAALRMTVFLLF